MRLPTVRGIIDRRMLLNYRVDPEVIAALLPAPFRPKVHGGFGLAGICLIRLKQIRPAFLPGWLGISSENAATRFAVEWDEGGVVREGVYIRRRDSSNWLNALAGGRVFPGVHSHGRFRSDEGNGRYRFSMRSDDGAHRVEVEGNLASEWSGDSIFDSLAEASAFFAAGSLGYSATADQTRFQGLELRCREWLVEPLAVHSVRSSYFDDPSVFPVGSIHFDCALLMRGVDHEWHGKPDLCCPTAAVPHNVSSVQ